MLATYFLGLVVVVLTILIVLTVVVVVVFTGLEDLVGLGIWYGPTRLQNQIIFFGTVSIIHDKCLVHHKQT